MSQNGQAHFKYPAANADHFGTLCIKGFIGFTSKTNSSSKTVDNCSNHQKSTCTNSLNH